MKKYWIPIGIIAIGLFAIYLTGFYKYFTFDELKHNQAKLSSFITLHPILAPVLFISLNIVAVFLLLPLGLFLSVGGGFLLPWPASIIYILIGTTTGACVLFLATKTALMSLYDRFAGPTMNQLEIEFQKDAVNYLLFLRLMPLSPFGLVNLAAAFLGVRFWTFAWTTVVGNIPPTIAFVGIGRELESILYSGKEITVFTLLNWKIVASLVILAILSLLPILVKRWRASRS